MQISGDNCVPHHTLRSLAMWRDRKSPRTCTRALEIQFTANFPCELHKTLDLLGLRMWKCPAKH